jgi:hypothetical protein
LVEAEGFAMTSRFWVLTLVVVFTVLAATPAHLHGLPQNAPGSTAASRGRGQMMAAMMASDAKLDELVKKMNEATGAAKVDAMAELLTTLVNDRLTMRRSMMSNSGMPMGDTMDHMQGGAGAMGGMHGGGSGDTTPPNK